MSTFATNFAPPDRADQLGSALQHGLPRPMNPKLSWTLVRTVVLGGISGGLAPVLALPGRFNNFIRSEQNQYWHLAEWVRLQSGDASGAEATVAAQRLEPAVWMPILSKLFVIAAIGVAWSAIHADHPKPHAPIDLWFSLIWPLASQKHTQPVWNLVGAFDLAVLGACLCWLIQINTHIARVRRFLVSFNQLSNHYGVGPVRAPGVHLGMRPFWLVAAAAMCAGGAYWAVPVMLTAAAHRSYVMRTTRRLRQDLARRQREVLLAARPAKRVTASQYLLTHCSQVNCQSPLPPEAEFCRRCGAKVTVGGVA